MDAYFSDSPPVIVCFDKDATSSKRPQKYIEKHEDAYRRNSSVVAQGGTDEEKAAAAGNEKLGSTGAVVGDENVGESSSRGSQSSTVVDAAQRVSKENK